MKYTIFLSTVFLLSGCTTNHVHQECEDKLMQIVWTKSIVGASTYEVNRMLVLDDNSNVIPCTETKRIK